VLSSMAQHMRGRGATFQSPKLPSQYVVLLVMVMLASCWANAGAQEPSTPSKSLGKLHVPSVLGPPTCWAGMGQDR
jgi:hypothetical protein